jgi:hypothetical protein
MGQTCSAFGHRELVGGPLLGGSGRVRGRRHTKRRTGEAKLPPGKTIAAFDFADVAMVSKTQGMALPAGDACLENGANVL